MKTTSKLLLSVLIALFTLPATLSAADNDWTTLIDGTEGMANFDIVGDADWTATQNAIQATEGSGASWLVTKDSYDDFVLRVEFWASEDANSGIYMRCANPGRITDRDCYEANIYDTRPDPSYGTGAIVHIAQVDEPRPQAGDRWNIMKITVDGDHLMVELNGETTVDVHDDQLDSGPVALQWAQGKLRFRKVQIREL